MPSPRVFIELGLAPGDRVAIQLPNIAELTMLAAWRAGLTVVMLPALWRHREIAKVCAELKPRALIGVGGSAEESPMDSLCVIAATELSVRFVLGFGRDLLDGVMSLDEALEAHRDEGADPVAARNLQGPVLISFTARAGVPLLPVFHGEDELLAQGAMTVLALALDRHDVILNPYPLSGATGLALGLMPWLTSGGALHQHQPFDYDGFVRQLLEAGATVTALPPSILATLERDGVLRDPHCKLRQLGCVWSTAPLADPMQGVDDVATSLFDLYPLGDLACLVRLRRPSINPALLPRGEISVSGEDGDGALFIETALGDGHGNAQAQGLKLRGPVVPRGSAGGPLAPDGQGFVASGLRALPAKGSELTLQRDPELLHHGGLAIAAAELDQLYQSFPGFQDAACFALSDPIVGDRIFAGVVPKAGQLASLETLHAFLHDEGVAPYKSPDRLVVVSTIPRDADGAVLRAELLREAQ